MIARIRAYLIRRRFKNMTRFWDDQIADAQARHKATAPIRAAKTEWLHACLRGGL